jgi:hypothetical protein
LQVQKLLVAGSKVRVVPTPLLVRGKRFFSKEKKQKTSTLCRGSIRQSRGPRLKRRFVRFFPRLE